MALLTHELGADCLDGLQEHDMKLKHDVRAAIDPEYFPDAGSCAGLITLILISLAICVWVFLHSGVAG
jgi:hypothetical protein